MSNFVKRIINYILERRKNRLEKTLAKMKPKTYSNSTTKTHVNSHATLILSSETQKNLEAMDEKVKNIVIPFLQEPEKMLDFVAEHGTPVYKFPQAKFVLDFIGEEEGFVTPLRGFKAFWLNFAVGVFVKNKLTFSLNSREMFVLRDMDVNVYYMLHQFHKWYGFKENLPGYDEKAQELFKENLENMTDNSAKELSVAEILALKEAISRDVEAAEFVINLAKEKSGAKNALNKIKDNGSAEI